MSADNYTYCPKCQKDLLSKRAKTVAEVEKQYGKIPAKEYHEAMAYAISSNPDSPPDPTLREDYQVGIYDGEFQLEYSAECQAITCNFKFTFNHKEKV